MADIFADCPWCKGRGCTFCPGEREKARRREDERLRRVWREQGFYCAPDFEYWSGNNITFHMPPDFKPMSLAEKRGITIVDGIVM